MHAHPAIAIITTNRLMGLGLKSILEKIIPIAEIETYASFTELQEMGSQSYMHYFIGYSVFSSNKEFFQAIGYRCIVLIENAMQSNTQGVLSININQDEEQLVKDILKLRNRSHVDSHSIKHLHHPKSEQTQLTDREKEVIAYIAQGFINKEIADKMNISITTVISHRKNIVGKLNLKSVAALTIYAINQGLVDPQSIVQ